MLRVLARLRAAMTGFKVAFWRTPATGADTVGLGRLGERLAERYLRRHGYRIVKRNFRAAGAEIDLVALDGDTLVFVEVKTRRGERAGTPAEAVGTLKQERLRRAAAAYVTRYRVGPRPMRFDVVAICGEGGSRRLDLLRDAF